jgi:hypothetical protein
VRIPLAAKAQPANGAIELVIEHIVIADMADGQPLPPLIEDNIVWHVVRRADGYTIWRRLFLSTSPVLRLAHGAGRSDTRAVRKDHDHGYDKI